MDEFNNERNPFDEQKTGGEPYAEQGNTQQQNPYAAQDNNAYGQQNPYSQQSSDPYNQQPHNANPYNQPNGGYNYNQSNPNPYSQQQQNVNPYQQNQQNFNPYVQQGGWQGMQQAQYNAAQQSTGMATASLVLGIISIVLGIPMLALPLLFLVPIIGLILGIVFKTKHLPVGRGLSTAGIITSSLGLVLPIILLVIVVIFMMSNPEFMREYMKQLKEISPEQYQKFYEQLGGQFPEWFESVLYFIFK